MNTKEEIKNYYLKEFSLFDDKFDITFNISDIKAITILKAKSKFFNFYSSKHR